jgi:hypothetical protein
LKKLPPMQRGPRVLMHEKFRKRLEVLEKAAALANRPPQIINIGFINPDKTRVVPTMAWIGAFKCYRLEGEDEDTFRARAHAECRAADPRPVQILIFSDKEIPNET